MNGINKVILVGHLGKDPDKRYLDNGDTVVSFPLVTTTFASRKALHDETPEWHNIVMWSGLAKAAHKTLKKGQLIYVEGKSKTRCYDDKSGNKNYITEIVVSHFTLLGHGANMEDESDSAESAMMG